MKVTLKKNGTIEAIIGAFCPRTVGTWHYTNVWVENAGRRDKSGNKLVRGIWSAKLKGREEIQAYTRQELIQFIKDKIK